MLQDVFVVILRTVHNCGALVEFCKDEEGAPSEGCLSGGLCSDVPASPGRARHNISGGLRLRGKSLDSGHVDTVLHLVAGCSPREMPA